MDCLRNKESNWNQINSKILKSLDTGVSKKTFTPIGVLLSMKVKLFLSLF